MFHDQTIYGLKDIFKNTSYLMSNVTTFKADGIL